MDGWRDHLIVAPILLPLAASGLMLLLDERRQTAKRAIGLAATFALLLISVQLLHDVVVAGLEGAPATRTYLIGDWPSPFGIVLVVDWLSALMLALTSILGFTSLVYATARWDSAGPRFHALFLLQLVGLNGAFLTGDLFNLFVFFEVLLAASYGLMLHGSGAARVKAGLHYVAINVATSLLFLIGAALIYGVAGTLNMADLATRIPAIAGTDLALFQAGMAVLGVAFLVKAGMWPLGFWLPPTYSAATPPAAALFAILSKVGLYAVLRVFLLLFGTEDSPMPNFGEEFLLYGGMATIAFGTIGLLACRTLSRLVGFSVLISSGTLLAALGSGEGAVLGAVLFYLVSSTLAIGAFYLLVELVERQETDSVASGMVEAVFDDEYTGAIHPGEDGEVGTVIPATIAILGGGFIFCALLLAGMPPLSGFIAKFAIIHGLLALDHQIPLSTWSLVALIIISGLATLIATSRAGIDLIWAPTDKPQPVLRVAEAAPVGLLLAICLALMVFAGPVMNYMERTGRSLEDRQGYIQAVKGVERVHPPVPSSR
ncbi:monovalent cation/H+ antiporter subunit D [Sphingosinicella rhizophila]|uniref:Monovalent cation/H+ antiporter subunit D n=1 Tax=Sphingosinicella rhizophila TaxID=3050082 RepID=A0ABU3QCF7_9SPHN|nr:monovalent cation/H+ antiporter subunit D [Sphingosinicella sp. GR2756]MDT9601058.1 monovalent cation/H+ antiporter subunit D [Sphingosinicella sp. GR2756]